ncbi:4Fe-4S dicluster domain-containing protein [Desulfococcus sp.]|uniref:4Fe-4S dicluster domain-containing protein n=1 Tax=Desulfococcus sp. TaxID=2025834 RepID=UPI003593782D
MKWTDEAETEIKKVPFFVRRKVRQRVEKEAAAAGKSTVGLTEVNTTRKNYLEGMAGEVKGYQLDLCFGPGGCPNRAGDAEPLTARIESLLREADLLTFLRREVDGPLKFHHEFRVTLAECPNACSQPQIKDVGIIAAAPPVLTDIDCTRCEACKEACPDDAVTLSADMERPVISASRCLSCGRCVWACPTGTLAEERRGFKVLLGGKLGRHPRLASEIPGIFSEDEVMEILAACLDFYKRNSRNGRRFAELLTPSALEDFIAKFGRPETSSQLPS